MSCGSPGGTRVARALSRWCHSACGSTRDPSTPPPISCVPCLDTARDALTQLVSVHPNAGVAAAASSLRVDIRRFPWINRLAADYAFDADRLSPFFAGDVRESAGVAAGHRARAGPSPPARHASPSLVDAQQGRRAAPPAARRRRRAPARPANGRHRHRPAGWTLRRTAVHRAQGADGAPPGRRGARHLRRARRWRCSGWTPKITTGRKSTRAGSWTPRRRSAP